MSMTKVTTTDSVLVVRVVHHDRKLPAIVIFRFAPVNEPNTPMYPRHVLIHTLLIHFLKRLAACPTDMNTTARTPNMCAPAIFEEPHAAFRTRPSTKALHELFHLLRFLLEHTLLLLFILSTRLSIMSTLSKANWTKFD
ncbi:hypothetical protein PIIN_11517 [Serendipita indica DSM 11827]|uniref:Uncharacterized protein n=1 Tax=Serendipita indica (strain DSM 11827) TaxID=1109443 RepID=G4U1U7_SERID|nr:hypothetical protein PIIN_11517 [Serendipita indica DSM 11827]